MENTDYNSFAVKQQILKQFSCTISNYDALTKEYDFYTLYDFNIFHLSKSLKEEINENLLNLASSKHKIYLDLVIKTIEESPFININPDILDNWFKKYDSKIDEFPNFKSKELNQILRTNDFYGKLPYPEFSFIESVQSDFYQYAAMLETKKLLVHTENLKIKYTTNNTETAGIPKKIKWIGKPSQLGYLIGSLAELDYIETPKNKDGEINYTQFSKDLIEIFDIKTTYQSLSKYLNLDSDKAQETKRKFEKEDFYIPNRKIVS